MNPLKAALLTSLPGIRHGFFTRLGGISTGPYATANMGLGTGDDPRHVRENRSRAAAALGLAPTCLLTARQVHGMRCLVVDQPFDPWQAPEADALFCERRGLAVGVLTADCAPVLLADPRAGRIAAVHAGWRGLLHGVLEATLAEFAARGSRPTDLYAAIGPCIGPSSYEVGPDFVAAFLARDPQSAAFFCRRAGERPHFDLPAYVCARLQRAGLPAPQIELLARDTCREAELFFSHRRNRLAGESRFGLQLSAILLA